MLETKSGEKREVPMNELVKNIRKSFWTALKKSGIKDFHFHDLRYTAASQQVMAGVDLNTVREILGHNSIEMTIRYAHLSPNHKKRAVDILGESFGLQEVSKNLDLVPV